MKRIMALTLAFVIFICSFSVAYASEDDGTIYSSGTIDIASFNVAGLPIPKVFGGRNVLKDTYELGQQLQEKNHDILCVQEDFNYHFVLSSQIRSKYRTFTSGGIPAGDGLNIFSKYPIYNVNRIKWDSLYGVYDGKQDELTPKGILYCTIEIEENVYIDLYNVHCDAGRDEKSIKAREDNLKQLAKLVNENSSDRAVIIVGDINTYLNAQDDLYNNLILAANLKDAWVEVCNNGVYESSEYKRSFSNSIERVLYRDGGNVKLEAAAHEYVPYVSAKDAHHLSDHYSNEVKMKYTYSESAVQENIELKEPVFSFMGVVMNYVKGIALDLFLAIKNIKLLFEII